MKKILNEPDSYVDEMLDGLVAAHPEIYARPEPRVIARAGGVIAGKVGIVTAGGSGHLPVFTGYVGKGLLDAAAIGNVFASPSAEQMAAAMRHAHGGAGVLRLYGNYGGDVMNFDMAGEMVDIEDNIRSTTVLAADDIASAPPDEAEKRRGVAGMVYAFKTAGALAEEMADLDAVTAIAQKTAEFLPLDRHRAHPVHRAAGGPSDLRDRRRRDGNGHGHPRRAGHLARQAEAGRRDHRRDDGQNLRRP